MNTFTETEKTFWQSYKLDLVQGIDQCINSGYLLAAAKLIFSSIDAMGLFYKGAYVIIVKNKEQYFVLPGGNRMPKSTKEENTGSKDCFLKYIENCWPDITDEKFRKMLYRTYRCGLLHEGRPKGSYIIGDNAFKVFQNRELSVKLLYHAFVLSIQKYDQLLEKEDYRMKRWHARYSYLHKNAELNEKINEDHAI